MLQPADAFHGLQIHQKTVSDQAGELTVLLRPLSLIPVGALRGEMKGGKIEERKERGGKKRGRKRGRERKIPQIFLFIYGLDVYAHIIKEKKRGNDETAIQKFYAIKQ